MKYKLSAIADVRSWLQAQGNSFLGQIFQLNVIIMEIENQMTVTKFPYYKNLPIYECSISSGSKILVIIDHAPCIVIVYYDIGT